MKRRIGLLTAALALCACAESPTAPDLAQEAVTIGKADAACMDAAEMMVVRKLNAARAAALLPLLEIDARLVAAAWRHSADMAATGKLDHRGSDGSSFVVRSNEAGYREPSGQFILRASPSMTPEQGARAFTADPVHLIALELPALRHVGVARELGLDGLVYWTVVLGADQGLPDLRGCPSAF